MTHIIILFHIADDFSLLLIVLITLSSQLKVNINKLKIELKELSEDQRRIYKGI